MYACIVHMLVIRYLGIELQLDVRCVAAGLDFFDNPEIAGKQDRDRDPWPSCSTSINTKADCGSWQAMSGDSLASPDVRVTPWAITAIDSNNIKEKHLPQHSFTHANSHFTRFLLTLPSQT